MTAPGAIRRCTLGDVADVSISGVDKKTKPGEIPVRLCNYTDVYYNWSIRDEMRQGFMQASAREEEIAKFRLRAGQVALTKDSETREDIGHPTFISTDFEDVILGYHCALISPHDGKLDGQYLNALLCTRYAADYFSRNAGGSGQRYYLSDSSIKDLPLFLPDFPAQQRIASLLGNLDDKITLNRRKIGELEALAKLIYDRWFVEFNFPDGNGRPYKESGGKMVWNEKLKREIPADWGAGPLGNYVSVHRGASPRPIQAFLVPAGLRWLKISDASKATSPYIFEIEDHIRPEGISKTVALKAGALVLSNSASPGIPKFLGVDSCIHDGWLYFPVSKFSYEYLFLLFEAIRPFLIPQGNGSVFTNLKTDILKMFPVVRPANQTLKQFDDLVKPIFRQIQCTERMVHELIALRDWLLPLLMNGQVEVAE